MDENKIIKLNKGRTVEDTLNAEKGFKVKSTKPKQTLFQTNPILHEQFTSNMNNKKNKFNFKDLFR